MEEFSSLIYELKQIQSFNFKKSNYFLLGFISSKHQFIEDLTLERIIKLDVLQHKTQVPIAIKYFFDALIIKNSSKFENLLMIYSEKYSDIDIILSLSSKKLNLFNHIKKIVLQNDEDDFSIVYNEVFDYDADYSGSESENSEKCFVPREDDIKCIDNKNHDGREEEKKSEFYMENQVFYKDITECKGELSNENTAFDTALDFGMESNNSNEVKNDENENEELDQFMEEDKNNKLMGGKMCFCTFKNFFRWFFKIKYPSLLVCLKS